MGEQPLVRPSGARRLVRPAVGAAEYSSVARRTPAESRGFADPPRDGGALVKKTAQVYSINRHRGHRTLSRAMDVRRPAAEGGSARRRRRRARPSRVRRARTPGRCCAPAGRWRATRAGAVADGRDQQPRDRVEDEVVAGGDDGQQDERPPQQRGDAQQRGAQRRRDGDADREREADVQAGHGGELVDQRRRGARLHLQRAAARDGVGDTQARQARQAPPGRARRPEAPAATSPAACCAACGRSRGSPGTGRPATRAGSGSAPRGRRS